MSLIYCLWMCVSNVIWKLTMDNLECNNYSLFEKVPYNYKSICSRAEEKSWPWNYHCSEHWIKLYTMNESDDKATMFIFWQHYILFCFDAMKAHFVSTMMLCNDKAKPKPLCEKLQQFFAMSSLFACLFLII